MDSAILLVVALAAERTALQSALEARRKGRLGGRPVVRGRLAGRDVLLVQAGIGPDRARETVVAASREFRVRAAWSLGFAGGLGEGLQSGDLVYPSRVLDDGDPAGGLMETPIPQAAVSSALRGAGLSVESGTLVTVGTAVSTPDAKRTLGRRTGAIAVDMEAAAVARAAHALGVPWAALKVVVDPVDESLPPFLAACATPAGDLCWSGLWAGARGGRPFWRALRRMVQASRGARKNLRRGLDAAFAAWAALTP